MYNSKSPAHTWCIVFARTFTAVVYTVQACALIPCNWARLSRYTTHEGLVSRHIYPVVADADAVFTARFNARLLAWKYALLYDNIAMATKGTAEHVVSVGHFKGTYTPGQSPPSAYYVFAKPNLIVT